MSLLGVSLVLEPPNWPVLLSVVAAAALVGEAIFMTLRLARRGGRGAAATMAAALAGGAALAGVGAWWGFPALALPALAAPAIIAAIGAAIRGRDGRARAFALAGAVSSALMALMLLCLFWTPAGQVVTLAAAALAWSVRAYASTTTPLKPKAKALLLGLRLLAVLLLALWALGPALEYRTTTDVRGLVLLAVDVSSSMQRRDMPPDYKLTSLPEGQSPVSRITSVYLALNDQRRALGEIFKHSDIELVPFDSKARPAVPMPPDAPGPMPLPTDATGASTALGDSLAAAVEPHQATSRAVTAIVLVSDGCNNTAATDATRPQTFARASTLPIYTVGVGSPSPEKFMRILSVTLPQDMQKEVEAFNSLPINAQVKATGLKGRSVSVVCRFGETVVGKKDLPVASDVLSENVQFVHVPTQSGYQRLTVTAEASGEKIEGLLGRPSAAALVHVVDREIRILYVEGRFRYESKYITQALSTGQRFGVDRRVLLAPAGAGTPNTLPVDIKEWLRYHAIILGDVPASCFTPQQCEIIRELVEKYGKGLCMIGGTDSFANGKWDATAVAQALPVEMAASDGQIDKEVRVVPTEEGLRDEMMQIDAGDAAAAWASLAPLSGANKLGGLKPAAVVLARSSENHPLIVAQQYGKGRSLAVAFDTTWRWVLNPKDTAALQRRFWRQVGLFLSAPKGNVWVATDRGSYNLQALTSGAEIINITAGVEDPRGLPMPKAPATVVLTGPDNSRQLITTAEGPVMRTGVLRRLMTPGVYSLNIEATVAGKKLAAEHKFEVVSRDLESETVTPDLDLLSEMSRSSGGQYAPLREVGPLLESLKLQTRPKPQEVVVHKSLGKPKPLDWPLVVLLLMLLSLQCIEWVLRKHKGLV
ncbi:MAG: glutamine amidotransferase [Planctomycetaceae bacterium]|nr:glutamine amidotransferase [Planctomycetaceae bacterium]